MGGVHEDLSYMADYNFLNYVALIDVMTNVLMSWNFLTT